MKSIYRITVYDDYEENGKNPVAIPSRTNSL